MQDPNDGITDHNLFDDLNIDWNAEWHDLTSISDQLDAEATLYFEPGTVGDGSFPGSSPITISVECQGTEAGESIVHPITIDPDWTIHTVHQLDLERIATAFSGARIGCLNVAQKVLPTLREWRQYNLRLCGIPLREWTSSGPSRASRWYLADDWRACSHCVERPWRQVVAAMNHQRSLEHWASMCSTHDWESAVCCDEAAEVWLDMVEPGWQQKSLYDPYSERIDHIDRVMPLQRPSHEVSTSFAALGFTSAAVNTLWSAGIHPAWLAQAFDRFGVTAQTDPNDLIALAINDTVNTLGPEMKAGGPRRTLAEAQGWQL